MPMKPLNLFVSYFMYIFSVICLVSGVHKHDEFGPLIERISIVRDYENGFFGKSYFRKKYGEIICQANTLTHVNTRIITNYLDLEFYCRDIDFIIEPTLQSIPRPNTNLIGTYIQNFDGNLFSSTSGEIFDFKSGAWRPSQSSHKNIYYLQPYQNTWVAIYYGQHGCKALAFVFPDRPPFCHGPVKLCHNLLETEDRNYGSEALFGRRYFEAVT